MQICWCMIEVQPNTLVNLQPWSLSTIMLLWHSFLLLLLLLLTLNNFLKIIFNFLSFTLQQISTKAYDIIKFAHTFYFNDQCQTVSGQQLIFPKLNLPLSVIKSEFDGKRVCKSDGCGFVRKWRNPMDSKSVTSVVTITIQRALSEGTGFIGRSV